MTSLLADHVDAPPGARDSRGNAFDSIRLIAAIAVLFSHSFMVSTGSEAQEPLYAISQGTARIGFAAVGIFFIISGLLIAASFERSSSLFSFIRKRALRILPALWACALITVFLIGPLVSEASPAAYFLSSDIVYFFRNTALALEDYQLAGVFNDRPMTAVVNGSLWTLKYEVACYALCCALMSLGNYRTHIIALIWIMSLTLIAMFGNPEDSFDGVTYHLMQMANLFRFFGVGMLFYLLRHHMALSNMAAVTAVAMVIAAVPVGLTYLALATAGGYAVLVLAYHAPQWLIDLTRKGDLSYGVYIYAFPIQQIVMPLSRGSDYPWLINTTISLPLTLAAAWCSWHFVEKPALALKSRQTKRPAEIAR